VIAPQKNQPNSDRLLILTNRDRPLLKINQSAIAYPSPQPAIAPQKTNQTAIAYPTRHNQRSPLK
jgi:hypothetical protein